MQFTYEAYRIILEKLIGKGFQPKNYRNWMEADRTVILRHDVDYNLQKAVALSEIEKDLLKGSATYFVLVSTNFYNVHSKESRECLRKIIKNGGIIGLHFDEMQYSVANEKEMKKMVKNEAEILSSIIDTKVDVVSMHRPSEQILSANVEFDDIINSYSNVYFKQMKYVSDSRKHWREDVDEIIEDEQYSRLHVVTHPFWYTSGQEKQLRQILKEAILNASIDYYENMKNNFRDLDSEIKKAEIEGILYR